MKTVFFKVPQGRIAFLRKSVSALQGLENSPNVSRGGGAEQDSTPPFTRASAYKAYRKQDLAE